MIVNHNSISTYAVILVVHLVFSYYYLGDWWNAAIGTLLIVVIGYLAWKKESFNKLGLAVNLQAYGRTIAITLGLLVLFYFTIKNIAVREGILIKASNWKNYFHTAFYVLNEEIVLGAMVLFPFLSGRRINPVYLSIIVAFLFTLMHFVFYKWVFIDRGNLQIITILTLVSIFVFRNNLILLSGHIAYSWALHFSWMVIMFGMDHLPIHSQNELSELTRFNMYLGWWPIFLASILLAAISSVVLSKRDSKY